MTYPFNVSIPAANNQLADDQPVMQTNNNSTFDLIDVDHVSFNDSLGGLHKQVTFSANQSAPGIGLGVSDLFANLSNSLSQLFFQNSSVTRQLTGLPVTNSGNNYGIVTPWGFTINFGKANTASSGNVTVTYAIQITSPVVFAGATVNTNSSPGTTPVAISTSSVGGTTMDVRCVNASSGANIGVSATFFYLVIGTTV